MMKPQRKQGVTQPTINNDEASDLSQVASQAKE